MAKGKGRLVQWLIETCTTNSTTSHKSASIPTSTEAEEQRAGPEGIEGWGERENYFSLRHC